MNDNTENDCNYEVAHLEKKKKKKKKQEKNIALPNAIKFQHSFLFSRYRKSHNKHLQIVYIDSGLPVDAFYMRFHQFVVNFVSYF